MSTFISIAMAKLYMLAERALRMFEKHRAAHPAVQSFDGRLPAAVAAFSAAFNRVQAHRPAKDRELSAGRASVADLSAGVRAWLGSVARDLPGFTLDVNLDRDSPDLVIGYADSLVAVVTEHAASLPYAQALLDNVNGLLESARAEWLTAQQALGDLQGLRRELRVEAVSLNRELIAFRRTLRQVLGSRHRDYQLLRVSRGSDDAEPVVESDSAEAAVAAQPAEATNGVAPSVMRQ